jgi:hypothetical protein
MQYITKDQRRLQLTEIQERITSHNWVLGSLFLTIAKSGTLIFQGEWRGISSWSG